MDKRAEGKEDSREAGESMEAVKVREELSEYLDGHAGADAFGVLEACGDF